VQTAALLLARWNALPRSLRFAVTALLLAGLAFAAIAIALRHPSRVSLFPSPLHPEQLAEVEERLASWNVAFAPTNDNVAVDASRRNDLLLRLSLAGIPHAHLAGTGEALSTVGVLTPEAVVDAQTRAGLAGDIEAGLRGIEGVDDARVIVAPAKEPEYGDAAAHEASASVRLRLQPGAQLPKAAISGIRAFVAASVPGLAPAHIAILDDRGEALRDDAAGGDEAPDLQRSLQSALDSAFGAGATVVRVRPEYDASLYSQRDVRRMPVAGEAIERSRESESFDGGGKRYRRVDVGEDRGSETHEVVAQVPAGALVRLSAAVFVDRARSLDLPKVRDLAAATLGFDARRGDALTVEAVAFFHDAVSRRAAFWPIYGAIVTLAPAVAVSVALIVVARLALPPLSALAQSLLERSAVENTSRAVTGYAPSRVRSILEREPPHAAAAIISALPAATATAVLDLYPPHEREDIVRRMQRPHSPLVGNADELLRRGG